MLAVSLAAPATLLAAQPSPPPSGPPALVNAEQPSPPSSPVEPSPPPADQAEDAAQPDQVATPDSAGREGRGRSAGAGAPAQRSAPASGSAARSDSVSIVGNTFSAFAFSPKSITVHVGDRVRWHNESSASEGHTVTGDGLDSGTFHQGEDYAFKFSHAGTFSYICALHPSMKGKVTVLASGGGGGGSNSGGGGSGGGGGGSSGSGSGSGGTSSGSGGASLGSDPGSSGQLPVTGLALVPLGAIGVGLLIGGMLLRRRAELYY